MKHFYLYLLLVLLTGCKSEHSQPPLSSESRSYNRMTIKITPVLNDSISIRALDSQNGVYWFGGNKGTFGKIVEDEVIYNRVTTDSLKAVDFRSIAVTESFTYVMTAGSPALIYKFSHTENTIDLVYKETGEKVFYDSMKFWNDREGIAFGDATENCLSIIMTKNAGETWKKVDCSNMPEYINGEAAFAASNSNIAINGDHIWLATGGAAARVIYSSDRGATWEAYQTPIISGAQMTGIFAMDFYNPELGIIIGGDWENKNRSTNTKALTKDGGSTWELIANGQGPGYCSDIIFIPNTEGRELLAVGSEGIWWSSNQGVDWQQIADEGFYTVQMLDRRSGYLAGRHKISRFLLQPQ